MLAFQGVPHSQAWSACGSHDGRRSTARSRSWRWSSSRAAPPGSRRPRRDPQRGYWGARPELDWIAATSLATLVFVEATSARRIRRRLSASC